MTSRAWADGSAIDGDLRLTERRNPRTAEIGGAPPEEIVRLLLDEEARVPIAVAKESKAIATLIQRVVESLRGGGRLFYVGAGTSGRLGVLDAAECPPTFGTEPGLVQGILAGGTEALFRSLEGAEDDEDAGRADIREAEVRRGDFVLGIATSGTTPYVGAALEEAKRRRAGVGFLSCTEPPAPMRELADVLVTPLVGPEAITGSTRLKAGTATKLVLNAVTTGAMIRLGKVYQNLMVDLQALSEKLVDRSIRILGELCGVTAAEARCLLAAAGGSAKTAIVMCELGASRSMAERLLDACDGFLETVLERFSDGPHPYYAGYGPPRSRHEIQALAALLAEGPERLVAAVKEEAARPGAAEAVLRPVPSRWGPSHHLAHLLEFESAKIPKTAGPLGALGRDCPNLRAILSCGVSIFSPRCPPVSQSLVKESGQAVLGRRVKKSPPVMAVSGLVGEGWERLILAFRKSSSAFSPLSILSRSVVATMRLAVVGYHEKDAAPCHKC